MALASVTEETAKGLWRRDKIGNQRGIKPVTWDGRSVRWAAHFVVSARQGLIPDLTLSRGPGRALDGDEACTTGRRLHEIRAPTSVQEQGAQVHALLLLTSLTGCASPTPRSINRVKVHESELLKYLRGLHMDLQTVALEPEIRRLVGAEGLAHAPVHRGRYTESLYPGTLCGRRVKLRADDRLPPGNPP